MPRFIDIDGTLSSEAAATARAAIGVERVFSVAAYGAVADGVTDDTTAIHAARTAAGVGGKVHFPAGTYLVDGLTANVANQTWELADGAVVKAKAGAANILYVTADNVTIDGGVFDGSNGTANDWSQMGIRVHSTNYTSQQTVGVTIRNVEVRDSPMHGIYALNSNRFTVTGCRIIDSYGGGVFVHNGTASTVVSDIVITDNYIESSGVDSNGIGVLGGHSDDYTKPVQRIKISGNTVILPPHEIGNQSTGAISCIQCRDWVISDNYCEGTELGITNGVVTRGIVHNNVVRKFSTLGIEISGPVTDCTISGNIIDGTETETYGAGILNSTGTIKGLSIVGNTMFGFTGQATGISFGGNTTVESAAIADNLMRADCTKFIGVSFSGTTSNVTISGNTFDAASITGAVIGVEFQKSVSKSAISGNVFTTVSATGSNYSIALNNVSGTASEITISGNTFTAGASAGFAALFSPLSATNVTFTGNTVNGETSTFSSAVELYGAVNGLTVSGNQLTNLNQSVVRMLTSTAVTLQNIRLAGNNVVNVPKQFTDGTSGGAAVAASVTSADQQVQGVTSTVTSGANIYLTNLSTDVQIFTGSSVEYVWLPSTNIRAGHRFTIVNNSSQGIFVYANNGSTLANTLAAGTSATFAALQNTPTTNAHWISV